MNNAGEGNWPSKGVQPKVRKPSGVLLKEHQNRKGSWENRNAILSMENLKAREGLYLEEHRAEALELLGPQEHLLQKHQ